jgi:hypothetical protein
MLDIAVSWRAVISNVQMQRPYNTRLSSLGQTVNKFLFS